MLNWRLDLRLLAYIELFLGFLMGVPTFLAFHYHEQQAIHGFLVTYLAIAVFCSLIVIVSGKPKENIMLSRDGYLVVTLTWVIATAFSAIPLVASGAYVDYSSAYFEIMSGFTTTGATVLTEIESLPKSILFWRSQTNWLGGMGIVVLFVALLPALGVSGTLLVGAESVGPTKDKLTPKIKNTALILWSIYIAFSVLETVFLLIGNLSLYDAVTVTFSTMAAAGFCVKNSSIGTFSSAYVDVVVTVFMLISGANFALYYKALSGKLSSVLKDGELRSYLGIWAFVALASALYLYTSQTYASFGQAFRYSAFQTASILTTTGFATTDYLLWPAFPQVLLLLLFFIGGCAGSAGGGVKVVRIVTLFKMGRAHVKQRIHPRGIFQVRVGESTVRPDLMSAIATFFGVYIFTGVIGTVLISLSGSDPLTSFAASFLCLGNIGIGFGNVGPTGNFAAFPSAIKWVCSFLMLVGRLELFTVYVLFSKQFWKR
ncbi:MAG: TrkH family potassium uptake protein [Sphaerochaeta sp.]|jgi:trk system potassium uptake protein TrkH|uniref:TrkH family potassium uptake protein n=1 Tax=Sphaerochaeta sp. TaxID=1972642 RepID=UPI003D110E6D